MGKRNILLNINNKAREYYSEILTNEQTTFFIDNKEDFVNAVLKAPILDEKTVLEAHRKVICPHYQKNIEDFIKDIL